MKMRTLCLEIVIYFKRDTLQCSREPSEPYLASSLVCEEGLVLAPPPPPPSVLGLEAVFREVSKSSWRILSPIGATVFFLLNVQSPGNCVCLKHLCELLVVSAGS